MKDILDAPIQTAKILRPIFSRFAFGTAMLEIGIAFFFVVSIPERIKVSDDIALDALLILIFRIVVVVGTVASILSIARKEKGAYAKWIGSCINFAFMLFFIYAIVQVNF